MTYIRILFLALHSLLSSLLALASALFDRSFNSYIKVARFFGRGILFFGGIKLTVKGLENISPDGVYVFVSNHSSLFDIVTIQYGIPSPLLMFFKKELAKIPVFGWGLYLGPYIMVDRQNAEKAIKSIQIAKNLMETKKFSVLLFAEGTRSETGEIQPFKRGAFNLAKQVGFPVVPVTIIGTHKIMPKKTFKLYPGKITMCIDKPMDTTHIKTRQDEIILMNKARDIIVANYNKETLDAGK